MMDVTCSLGCESGKQSICCLDCGVSRCQSCQLPKEEKEVKEELYQCGECYSKQETNDKNKIFFRKFVVDISVSNNETECMICNDDSNYRRTFIFNCGHSYCGKCVAKIYGRDIPHYCDKSQPGVLKEKLQSLAYTVIRNCPSCKSRIALIVKKTDPSQSYTKIRNDPIALNIFQFDLRKLRNRIFGKGIIPSEKLTTIMKEYKKFMVLKYLSNDYVAELLSPPPAVDLVWHEHILDTVNYQEFCEIFPQFVNHNPEGVFDGV